MEALKKLSINISSEDYKKLLLIKEALEKQIGIKLNLTQVIMKILNDSKTL